MPTVSEVDKLRQEVESLKARKAHAEGVIAQMEEETGVKGVKALTARIRELEVEREALLRKYEARLERFRKKYPQLVTTSPR